MINNHTLTKYTLANDCKRALNTRGNLVFRYRIYHPKQPLTFLSYFSFSCFSTSYLAFHSKYTNSSSAKRSSPSSLEILQIAHKALISRLVVVRARSKFISESFKSKLNSDSSDEKEMILNQNLDVLVPKHIGTIYFACHFLEQIQRAD